MAALTSTRAKHIYGLSGPIMLIDRQLPKSLARFAYLNLATRDPYHLRWGLLRRVAGSPADRHGQFAQGGGLASFRPECQAGPELTR